VKTPMPETELSRISKLFVDRDEMTVQDALARRRSFVVVLVCGADVATSRVLQLAVLTAVNLADRCFPKGVYVALDDQVAAAPLLVWPSLRVTFGQALSGLLGSDALTAPERPHDEQHEIIFGNAVAKPSALRVTFDGWVASVGPARLVERLDEREYCSLSGVLAAALAVCELFLSFAEINVEAGRRRVALSLWRPDADVHDPSGLGVPEEFLPKDLWVLGLGHLGNAYLWSLASLPYARPEDVEIVLNDFDRVGAENIDTGVLLSGQRTWPTRRAPAPPGWRSADSRRESSRDPSTDIFGAARMNHSWHSAASTPTRRAGISRRRVSSTS
jgi:hypothetical protein